MSGIEHAPVIQRGSSGEWVTYLQQLLAAADTSQQPRWPVTVTGRYDSATEHAVRTFQTWVPLPATGVVDAHTWNVLHENAQRMESVDETVGLVAGDSRAGHHGHKLEAGEQVHHAGWKQVSIQATVRDFSNQLLSAPAYLRFVSATDGAESDEHGRVDDGTFTMHNLWVPAAGTMTLYLAVAQGSLTHLSGVVSYQVRHGQHLVFDVRQDSEEKTVSSHEAEERGWTRGMKVSVGTDFEVLSTEAEISTEDHGGTSHQIGEEVHVRLPRPTLALTQTS